ncbi:uncharacterized protein [Primulina eburnea]|uniref:uncharacterized protein n=1 Tax=Primulina eburnea TaxID=1245227 RepID=UPI003C6BDCCE
MRHELSLTQPTLMEALLTSMLPLFLNQRAVILQLKVSLLVDVAVAVSLEVEEKNGNNNNRPTCQICGYSGHVAEKCYYRFDKDFVPQHRNSGPPFQPTVHPNRGPPSAAVAMKQPNMLNEDWWFPDSGASHHVTNDLGYLTIGSEFTGEGSSNQGSASQRQLT